MEEEAMLVYNELCMRCIQVRWLALELLDFLRSWVLGVGKAASAEEITQQSI